MSTACNHFWAWTAAVNETGWSCLECAEQPGEPPGFCPELDRSHTTDKVESILMDLHESNLFNVSNGSEGERITETVAERCHELGRYDQNTIIAEILALRPSHAEYWKRIGDGVVAGNDPRDRCHCGALATCSTSSKDGWVRTCRDHSPDFFQNARTESSRQG
jgi:hypothetical protein